MIKVLVTGSDGQVGSEIKALSSQYDYDFIFTNKSQLNIASLENIENFTKMNNINVIINCAAYTAVDLAENDEYNADQINHRAVGYLAKVAKENNIKLVHISTDYVYDGKKYKPYIESDSTNPNCVYGKTKLDGDNLMIELNPKNSIIIRTSWVYSYYGKNFVKTMLKLGNERESLSVVYDQIGTPTYAKDLAKTILVILPKLENDNVEVYNYSNEGVLSWYDFSKEIMNIAELECAITPIETIEYPTPAKRPYFSILNKKKIKEKFGVIVPYWKDSLVDCLKRIQTSK